MYECKLCNYSTPNKYNFNIHIQTNKHKGNEKEKFKCYYCEYKFSSKQHLYRHLKSSNHWTHIIDLKDSSGLVNDYSKLESEFKLIKERLRHKDELLSEKDKRLNEKERVIDIYKHQVESTELIGGSSVRAFNKISKRFPNAPPFKAITDYKRIQDGKSNKEFAAILLNHHKKKQLHVFIGTFILSVYKNENPELQSLWNIDSSRYSYIIKEIINLSGNRGTTSIWRADKGGSYLMDKVIVPLLKYLTEPAGLGMLELLNTKTSMREFNRRQQLNEELDAHPLAKQVLKYVSPRLHVDNIPGHIFDENELEDKSDDKSDSKSDMKSENKFAIDFNIEFESESESEESDRKSKNKKSEDESESESSDSESSDSESSDSESSDSENSETESESESDSEDSDSESDSESESE